VTLRPLEIEPVVLGKIVCGSSDAAGLNFELCTQFSSVF